MRRNAHLLRHVPRFNIAQVVVGTGRQLKPVLETKYTVYAFHEIEQGANLFGDLMENVN